MSSHIIVALDGSANAEAILDDGTPTTFIERFFGKDQPHLLIVTTREQAEAEVLSFLHRSNVPVLFLHG